MEKIKKSNQIKLAKLYYFLSFLIAKFMGGKKRSNLFVLLHLP
jgi:hypothetical protein